MRLVGIDIGMREVRVARAERRLGKVTVTHVVRMPAADDTARATALARVAGWGPQVVHAALPLAAVTHRFLTLPFRDRRRLARTVPLELAGQLPFDAGDAAVAFARLGAASGGSAVLAALAPRAALDALLAPLRAAGLAPVSVALSPLPVWNLIPPAAGDLALLLADGARSALALRRGGRPTALRALAADASDPAALAAETRWALQALGDPPPRLVLAGADAGPALARAIAAATGVAVSDLASVSPLALPAADLAAGAVAAGLVAGAPDLVLAGEAARPVATSRVAALAGVALALLVADLGLVRWSLVRRDAALARAIQAEAAAALPGAAIVAPQAQLEEAVARAGRAQARTGGPGGTLGVLRELAVRVPGTLRLDVDELALDPDGLRLHGRCDSFEAVDLLRRALASSPYLSEVAAEETRTTVDGRHVEFRLRATRRASGGTES